MATAHFSDARLALAEAFVQDLAAELAKVADVKAPGVYTPDIVKVLQLLANCNALQNLPILESTVWPALRRCGLYVTVEVHMLAFATDKGEEVKVRKVDVPKEEWDGLNVDRHFLDARLGLVYHYGQNDFQAKRINSVSAGDVILFENEYYMVAPVGFRKLTTDEYTSYLEVERRDRHFHPLVRPEV